MPDEGVKRVCLGRAIGGRGLKGEVRIKTFTQDPMAIASYGTLQNEAGTRQFEISNVQAAKDGVVARLKGVSTREDAEALKGVEFYVDRAALPEVEDESTIYYADLIGLVAIDDNGSALGQVVSVQNFGAGDLLEVRPCTGGATVLVPFTQEIVPDIDREAGWLLMLAPEGIFED
ncbi:MAG: ribosome maturation factor RimM [Alphaproteobacteria bacterium]